MSASLIVALILLIIIVAGIFSGRVNATYQGVGSFVAAIAALVLFLVAINVIHL